MCCTSCESSSYGRGRSGRLSRNHRLNMQRSSPVCNTLCFRRRWLTCGNAPIRSRSYRWVSIAFGAHRGRSKAVVARAHIPLLQFTLRDRVCTTKIAKCVDRGGSPCYIWCACCRQGEGTSCGRPDRPPWQANTGFFNC